jgi:gliding motility-associated-like protein
VKRNSLIIIFLQSVILVCCVVANARAQSSFAATVGQTIEYSVADHPGSSYLWFFYDDPALKNKVTPDEALLSSGNLFPTVSVKWGKPGTYYAVVLETNSSGCTNTKGMAIKVDLFDLSLYAGKDTTIGACTSIVLNGSTKVKTGRIFQWSILGKNGTLSNPNSLNPVFTPDVAGDYKIMLTSMPESGLASTRDTVVITVDKAPFATIVQSNSNDLKREITLDGSGSIGKGLSYQWFNADGLILGSNKLLQLNVNIPGAYSLAVKDSYGCVSTKSMNVNIESPILRATDDFARTSWVEPVTISVLGNDFLSTGNLSDASLSILKQPKSGLAQINSNGTITYSPNEKNSGRDQFTYEVCTLSNTCDSAVVTIDITDPPISIPEGISPNGDGINDRYVIKGLEKFPDSKVTIYTRGGELVYQSDNYQSDWDGISNAGNAKNQLVQTGVYYVVLKLGVINRTLKDFVYVSY